MWSYRENDLGSEFMEARRFYDMSNITPEIIINNMRDICNKKGIPASFDEARFLDGGAGGVMSALAYGQKPSLLKALKKREYKAVKISHPNPPQSYCAQLYIILEDGVGFFYVGESKAFKERNEYERVLQGNAQGVGLKSKLKAFVGIKPDEVPYEKEMKWHEDIYSVFETICK